MGILKIVTACTAHITTAPSVDNFSRFFFTRAKAHWHEGIARKLIASFGLFIVFYAYAVFKTANHASEPG